MNTEGYHNYRTAASGTDDKVSKKKRWSLESLKDCSSPEWCPNFAAAEACKSFDDDPSLGFRFSVLYLREVSKLIVKEEEEKA
ncbi:hypothetical protein L6164_000897 [Bauhinia variegata]|uniref:Uncharacterized protein n=1 Tax=Bauhinia variegata TaxID=167791 RepID=A0ACB9Q822_BAUVA|nr:hypothetical protein L6164_000897 [Bauhinia variegata]